MRPLDDTESAATHVRAILQLGDERCELLAARVRRWNAEVKYHV